MYNWVHAMLFSRRLKPELSVMVILCTLGIFLFSAPVGPYSAVHGPVTALRALRASVLLFWSMVIAAFNLVALLSLARRFGACSSSGRGQSACEDRHANAVLRC